MDARVSHDSSMRRLRLLSSARQGEKELHGLGISDGDLGWGHTSLPAPSPVRAGLEKRNPPGTARHRSLYRQGQGDGLARFSTRAAGSLFVENRIENGTGKSRPDRLRLPFKPTVNRFHEKMGK